MTTISHRETMIVKKKLEVQKINFVNTTLTNVIQKTLKITLMRLDETQRETISTG